MSLALKLGLLSHCLRWAPPKMACCKVFSRCKMCSHQVSLCACNAAPLVQELTPDKLGFAKSVREVGYGTTKDRSIIIEGCPNLSAVTIWVRGGNKMVLDEVRRSLHDAL